MRSFQLVINRMQTTMKCTAIHLHAAYIECKEQKNYVYMRNLPRIIFHPRASYIRFVSFSLQTFHLFILKSSEIYYRYINQETQGNLLYES